jgi:hypothetical protein
MVNATTINSDADAAEGDGRDWGPWYLPWWKWPIALAWGVASVLRSGGGDNPAAALAGGAIGSVVGAVLLVYLLTRVSRGLRE